jgi:cell wall-associated NlpC family hydrolase
VEAKRLASLILIGALALGGTACEQKDVDAFRQASPEAQAAIVAALQARPAQAQSVGAKAAEWAMRQVGKAYVYGATGPNAFDCSGLTMRAYQHAGVSIPRTSAAQAGSGRRVGMHELQPGDLLHRPGHVAMYVGNGMQVAASKPSTGVVLQPIYRGVTHATRRG